MTLVLASASQRRRDLLTELGLTFEIEPSGIDEPEEPGRPERVARRLARAKAAAVAARRPQAIVLAADTVVALGSRLLAKPADAADARAMLQALRGRANRVITAVTVVPPGGRRPYVGHARTRVIMRRYGDDEIEASVSRRDPFDKAGGYAIQDERLQPVAAIDGCRCNVVGLPLWTALGLLERAGLSLEPKSMPSTCATCPLRGAALQ